MRAQQASIAAPVSFAGPGLHSGLACRVTISAARAGSGIYFRRTGSAEVIRAAASSVTNTQLSTALGAGGAGSVATVEHLLAALAILGVDNAAIEVDGPEVPILDGSAAPFISAIEGVGLQLQAQARFCYRVNRPLRIEDRDRYIALEPSQKRTVQVSIDFADAAIGKGEVFLDMDDPVDMHSRLAPARTFCRLADVAELRQRGLALGGSLENAVVVDADRLLNREGLRDPHEFALHKALDLVGDLALLGAPILGGLRAHKSGHDLNAAFARRIEKELADGSGAIEFAPLSECLAQRISA